MATWHTNAPEKGAVSLVNSAIFHLWRSDDAHITADHKASRDAVHVSLLVMAIGVIAWLATRWHARVRAAAD